jgi:DNA-binding MarR family transcriptional regulator
VFVLFEKIYLGELKKMEKIDLFEVAKKEKRKRSINIHLTAKWLDLLQSNDVSVAKFMDKLLCNYMKHYEHEFKPVPEKPQVEIEQQNNYEEDDGIDCDELEEYENKKHFGY